MATVTPIWFAGARMSHCSAPVAGLNHSSELLPVQLVGAWISSRAPSAVSTSLSPSVCGTLTRAIEPLRAGVSACGRAPLTGTSQSCGLALFGGSQDASTVVAVHQRTGLQLSALA